MRSATTYEILLERAESHPEHPLVQWQEGEVWKTLTTRQGLDAAARLAGGIARLGVKAGDRVAILSGNRYEWLLLDLAFRHLGAVTVGLYPTESLENWKHVLNEANVVAIAISSNLAPQFLSMRDQLSIPHIISLDGPIESIPEAVPYKQLEGNAPIPAHKTAENELATLIYTSGTTGNPLGVMLTHDNLTSNAVGAIEYFAIGPTDVYLSLLPLCHAFERTAQNSMMRAGACVVFGRGLAHVVADLGEVNPTIVCVVPRLLEKVYESVHGKVEAGSPVARAVFKTALQLGRQCVGRELEGRSLPIGAAIGRTLARRFVLKKVKNIFGKRLRYVVSGGAPLSPVIAEFIFAVGLPCYEGYGITECSPIVSANHIGKARLGTVGEALPGVEAKIGQDGEIMVKGPNVMVGYYNNPEATANALEPDGWFHTGDLGRIDQDGFISILDRKKEILVTAGGKNISPAAVEGLALKSRFISQICIFANNRKFVSALVVPDFEAVAVALGMNGASLTTVASKTKLLRDPKVASLFQREIDKVNEKLARFENIRRFALLAEEFTTENAMMTATLKVRRKIVELRYGELINSLYNGSNKGKAEGDGDSEGYGGTVIDLDLNGGADLSADGDAKADGQGALHTGAEETPSSAKGSKGQDHVIAAGA